MGRQWKHWQTLNLRAPKSLWMVTSAMNQKMIDSWQENDDKPRQHVEKQRHHLADKGLYSQGYGLPSGHIRLGELDHKEGRAPKNRCLWTVVLEMIPESLLDSKEIKPVNLNENQPWIITGRTGAEAKAPVFWSSDGNRLIGKVPDAGRDWGQEKKASENEMAWWYHQCNKHKLGQTPRDGEGQGGLACFSPWGRRQSDTTGQLNNNNNKIHIRVHSWCCTFCRLEHMCKDMHVLSQCHTESSLS